MTDLDIYKRALTLAVEAIKEADGGYVHFNTEEEFIEEAKRLLHQQEPEKPEPQR